MEKDKYMAVQNAIITIGKATSQVPDSALEEFLKAIREAETIAPIIDPTLYRKSLENLTAIKNLALKVKELKDANKAVLLAVLNTAAKQYMEKMPDGDYLVSVCGACHKLICECARD